MNWQCRLSCLMLLCCQIETASAQGPPFSPTSSRQPNSTSGAVSQANREFVQRKSNPPSRLAITPKGNEPENTQRPERAAGEPFSLGKVFGALIIAIAGIFGLSRLLKSYGPFATARPLPGSIYELLGTMTLPPRQTLYLMRIGPRVILVSSNGENLANVAEFTDSREVASLIAMCKAEAVPPEKGGSFLSRVLNRFHEEPAGEPRSPEEETAAKRALAERLQSLSPSAPPA